MIEAGTLLRVKCPKSYPQKTQLGSPIENDPDWRYPEVTTGDLVTVVGKHQANWEAILVLASIDGTPWVGWLYHYELEQVQAANDSQQGR